MLYQSINIEKACFIVLRHITSARVFYISLAQMPVVFYHTVVHGLGFFSI